MYICRCYTTFIYGGFIEMKNILVISGHGGYATAIKESLEMLAGNNQAVKSIDFTVDDSDVTLKKKMFQVIKENAEYGMLFICDLLGGTPFKSAVELSIGNDNIEVVAGCNVGSILEISLRLDSMAVGDLADDIVDTSNRSTIRFIKSDFHIVSDDLDDLDGDIGI